MEMSLPWSLRAECCKDLKSNLTLKNVCCGFLYLFPFTVEGSFADGGWARQGTDLWHTLLRDIYLSVLVPYSMPNLCGSMYCILDVIVTVHIQVNTHGLPGPGLPYSGWFLFSSCIHSPVDFMITFLSYWVTVILQMFYSFFICSVEGHLGHFHFLAIRNEHQRTWLNKCLCDRMIWPLDMCP